MRRLAAVAAQIRDVRLNSRFYAPRLSPSALQPHARLQSRASFSPAKKVGKLPDKIQTFKTIKLKTFKKCYPYGIYITFQHTA